MYIILCIYARHINKNAHVYLHHMSIQKKIIIIASLIFVTVILVIVGVYYVQSKKNIDILPPEDAGKIRLVCSNGYTANATYYDPAKDGVMKRLLLVTAQGEDIKQYLMLTTVAASGAKFATRDGMSSFWEHQGEFTFEQNGTVVAICKDASKQTFILDGEIITLIDGVLEKEIAPGSVSKDVIRYFGNEAVGDINGDGKDDKVFFVTRSTGGTGLFYYVVGMLATDVLPRGTKSALIGDRIAPQQLEVRDGVIIVNYADRKPDEPFTAEPSVGKTVRLRLDTIALDFGKVVQDFEGEADQSKMTLSMKEWKWIKTTYTDDKEIFPKKKEAFVITFTDEGGVSFTTDCNSMSAEYTTITDTLSFGPIASTKMFCEGSQETEFQSMLKDVEKHSFTSRGELALLLKKNGGTMLFR